MLPCTDSNHPLMTSSRLRQSPILTRVYHHACSQETQTYHNAFKLLQPLGRPNSVGPASDLHDQQSSQRHLGRQPEPADPDATAQPPPPPPIPTSAHDSLDVSTITTISPTTPPTPPPPSPPSHRNPAAAPQQNPYTPHTVSLPLWQPPPTSLSARKALTHALSTSPSYTRLHQLLLDNAAEFNSYHTCATLRRALELHAAGLTPRESRLFKEGCSTLQVCGGWGEGDAILLWLDGCR